MESTITKIQQTKDDIFYLKNLAKSSGFDTAIKNSASIVDNNIFIIINNQKSKLRGQYIEKHMLMKPRSLKRPDGTFIGYCVRSNVNSTNKNDIIVSEQTVAPLKTSFGRIYYAKYNANEFAKLEYIFFTMHFFNQYASRILGLDVINTTNQEKAIRNFLEIDTLHNLKADVTNINKETYNVISKHPNGFMLGITEPNSRCILYKTFISNEMAKSNQNIIAEELEQLTKIKAVHLTILEENKPIVILPKIK